MDDIRLRPAAPGDFEFCFHVHNAAMGQYITAVWGWDEEDQRSYHADAFDPTAWQIITVGGADVGMVHIEHRAAEIYLSRLELAPTHQGRGIGTRIIQDLKALAAGRGHTLTLDVLAVNIRARRLYQQLGFTETCRHGKDDIKIRMSILPGTE